MALEMVLHEVAHVNGTGRNSKLRKMINAEFAECEISPHNRIWHVIQFYTVGELVRDAIADEQPDYIPYADKKGLYHGEWKRYRSLIKSYWLP